MRLTSIPWLSLCRTRLRDVAVELRRQYLNRVWRMRIAQGCAISFTAKLDKTNPRGVLIGRESAVNFGAAILSHDLARGRHAVTQIGERCQIGAHSIVMAGVTIGDGSVVAAGSVVMNDVPPGALVYGNPARVIETGLVTGKWGRILARQSDGSAPAPAPLPRQAAEPVISHVLFKGAPAGPAVVALHDDAAAAPAVGSEAGELEHLIADALGLPVEEVTHELEYNSVPEWDSSAHMALVAGIEERHGIVLNMDEVLAMSSVRKIREVLDRHRLAA